MLFVIFTLAYYRTRYYKTCNYRSHVKIIVTGENYNLIHAVL